MASISYVSRTLGKNTRALSGLDTVAVENVLNNFSSLQYGHLMIHCGDDNYEFGEKPQDTDLHAVINVHDIRLFKQLMLNGIVAAGETYMQGLWSTPDLVSVIRVFCRNMAVMQSVNQQQSLLRKLSLMALRFFDRNSLKGSRKNISAHYDLGNDFFSLFLDSTMMYSAAIYPSPQSSLLEASTHKLDVICRKLQLNEHDHLLEIGTGWGGMAIHAAKFYGCKVTTTTISKEQFEHASKQVKQQGLDDKITLLCEDYRQLTGQYDKLVSIEMIEAVGYEYYKSYFSSCSHLLKNNGLALIQAITISDQRFEKAKHEVDFIQRYIFPGGCLPSNAVIARSVSDYTDMQVVDLHDISQDYARTLHHWREQFMQRREDVKAMGFDDVFIAMWEFYLCYCEGGFSERVIHTAQYLLAKPQARNVTLAR